MSPRAAAALVLVIGLAAGSLTDRLWGRASVRAGDYWILAGDFHVHAFPGDGALAPWALRDEARRAGLDVFAVTNHNMIGTARMARWIAGLSNGPIVLAGQEITSSDYHLIGVGLEREVRADRTASEAIADVHAQGGVAIAAHPVRTFRGWDDAAVAALDGVEAAHPTLESGEDARQDLAGFFRRARQLQGHVSPIGSSDFHIAPELGECRTLLFVRELTASGVLDAIRQGMTVAEDRHGHRYGDAPLIQLLEHAAPAGRTDGHPAWRRISMALAWLGALGMLVCGKR